MSQGDAPEPGGLDRRQNRALWLLIDGYNIVSPTAPPRNPGEYWLHRERMLLIKRLAEHLELAARERTCVVFDAADPPPDQPSHFWISGIEVRFAVDHPEADDLLEELIAAHSAPKSLAVVSSDQRIQTAARRRGSLALDSQSWFDRLLDGKVILAVSPRSGAGQGGEADAADKPQQTHPEDVQQWLREFGFDES